MKKAPHCHESTSKIEKPGGNKGTQRPSVPKLFRAVPFHLPNHTWVPVGWLVHFPPESVIQTFADLALVRRRGKRQRVFPEPKEGEDAVCAWAEERYQNQTQKFLTIDRDIEASLLARAKRKKSGAAPMALKAGDLIEELFAAAKQGNEEAASSVAEILLRGVSQLTELAKANPNLLRGAARRSLKWPVLKSRHPYISEEHEKLFGELNLGYDLPFYFDRSSHWKMDDFTEIALDLLGYVWRSRKENSGLYDYSRVGELADSLPEFRKGTNANKWWELAKAHLLFSYPKPEMIPELADLVRLKRRTPSIVRARILERIEQRFMNFAHP